MDEGVEEVPLGLYLVKGDMMYVPILSNAIMHNEQRLTSFIQVP